MMGQKLTIFAALAVVIFLGSPDARAQDTEQNSQDRSASQQDEVNLSSTIVGNQEQPKVLYIVPWKSVNAAGVQNQTIQSQLDLIFGHVEAVELRRELKYKKQLQQSTEGD